MSGALIFGCAAFAAEPALDDARRLTAILDYVAADYPAAVVDGRVANAAEYAEQIAFLEDAASLAAGLPPRPIDLHGGITELRAAIEGVAPAGSVRVAALDLRRVVLDAYGVVLVPPAPVSRARGAALYADHCVECHAADGGADTPAAAHLVPPPRSFRDPEVMADLTPARAYNALTDGLDGTAMGSFAFLSAAERWDLAFHVFTLRHDADAEARGAALAAAGRVEAPTPGDLAALGDQDLAPDLSGNERSDAVAWLRGVAGHAEEGEASFAEARRLLSKALAVLEQGDRTEARRIAGEAYLVGFEPHEPALRSVAPDALAKVEGAFLSVRSLIQGGASVTEVEREILRAQALLDDAEGQLAGATGARVAFVGALLVFLREGLESALLLLLLLGYAARGDSSAVRQVHAGWLAAVGLGIVTWFASDVLLGLAGAGREAIEGVVALLAAGVMVTAHHWISGAAEGRRRVEHIRTTLGGATGRWTLTGLAFVAVYREAFEVVLFLRAIMLDTAAGPAPVLAGLAAGALLLVALVVALMRFGQRLKPARLLTAASVLLCVMAVVFVGKGLRALQEAGFVPIHPLGTLRIEVLGVYPTVETLLAQTALVIVLLVPAVWSRGGRATARSAPSQMAAK